MNDSKQIWKETNTRSTEVPTQLPENPAGAMELTDTDLENVSGAFGGWGWGWGGEYPGNWWHGHGYGHGYGYGYGYGYGHGF